MNRAGQPGYDPGLQRHHLLPCQLLRARPFLRLFAALDARAVGFDDFRRNGLLLPARDDAARLLGLPLHRGPHRIYNAMVMERVGAIEQDFARLGAGCRSSARRDALFRFDLLQRALRRRLLAGVGGKMALNRQDPGLRPDAFDDLDAMAETLWGATQAIVDQARDCEA